MFGFQRKLTVISLVLIIALLMWDVRGAHLAQATTTHVTRIVKLDVLVVICTNTAGGQVDSNEIAKLKEEIAQAQEFYWRNSHLKLYLNILYLIIDRYLSIDEFWDIFGERSYWLGFWSIERDLRNSGITDNQYDGVVVFYGWGDNEYRAALGGGTYGVDVGFLGQTGYTAIPLCWDPDTNNWYFIHEFHHQIDSMFDASGLPEYPSADLALELEGDFGENHDFNAYILRTWPIENWFKLIPPWGDIIEVEDNDQDDVPDEFPGLPITEAILGSSNSSYDSDNDGLSDLEEVMAGIFSSSDPLKKDTDGDGIIDGLDLYPLYPLNPYVPKKTVQVDGELENEWHSFTNHFTYLKTHFKASIKLSWDDEYFYIGVETDNFAEIHIYIDANNNGWFHGKDNYEIIVDPSYTDPSYMIGMAHIWDCTNKTNPTWNERLIDKESIKRAAKKIGNGYAVELAIPKNAETGLIPKENSKIGLRFEFHYIRRDGRFWGTTFEQWSFVDIILGKIPFVWIDQSFVSRERCDIGSVQTAGFHAVYGNGSPVTEGMIYINGTGCPINGTGWATLSYPSPNVRKISFTVTDVKADNHTEFKQVAPDGTIIWDRVNVTLSLPDTRINIGGSANILKTGVYEYDGAPFTGNVILNDTETKEVIGRYAYTTQGISDPKYGLTVFTSNTICCIFDRVNINYLSVIDDRIDIGATARFIVKGIYEYDGEEWSGMCILNDTATKNKVGKYGYKISSITDDKYGLTDFRQTAPEVYVIFDRIKITTFSVVDNRIEVGATASFTVAGVYEYDNTAWSETCTLNDTATKTMVGKYGYKVSSITDSKYGLTIFQQSAPDLYVIFDRIATALQAEALIPGSIKLTVRLRYQFDGAPVVDAKVLINGIEATNLGDGSYTISISTWSPYVAYNFQVDRTGFNTMRMSGSVFASGNIAIMGLTIVLTVIIIIVVAIRIRRGKI